LIDKYQRKDNLICHSERSEESPIFIDFSLEVFLKAIEEFEK